MPKELDARLTELEIQLSYATERLNALDEALRDESARVRELEEAQRVMQQAFKRLSQSSKDPGDVLQGHEDPVPSSG